MEYVQRQRMASAVAVSCAYHLAAIAVLLIAIRSSPHVTENMTNTAERLRAGMIWVAEAGRGGGGDAAANRMKPPPRLGRLTG